MLTNEQRAHDLAVASLPFMRDIIETETRNGEKIVFDAYYEYKNLYTHFLSAVSEDFKDED